MRIGRGPSRFSSSKMFRRSRSDLENLLEENNHNDALAQDLRVRVFFIHLISLFRTRLVILSSVCNAISVSRVVAA